MSELLFWLYLTNIVMLIIHEMDSVYWKEWDLFGLGGGVTGFLLLHFPLLFLALYGLALVFQQTFAGLIFSLVIGLDLFLSQVNTYKRFILEQCSLDNKIDVLTSPLPRFIWVIRLHYLGTPMMIDSLYDGTSASPQLLRTVSFALES